MAVIFLTPPPAGMSQAAWRAAAVGTLMAVWWVTEAIPIPATALVPLVAFPLLGVLDVNDTASPYANPVVFLFMGGFLLANAVERVGLHTRLALNIIRIGGTRPPQLVAGFMVATGFISMWVSNTATVAMMLPLASSVLLFADRQERTRESDNFGTALMLGVAYAASIGGLGTLIGTPPNALLAGFLADTYGVRISFVTWLALGVPIVATGLPVAWLLLRAFFPMSGEAIPGGRAAVDARLGTLGPLSRAEKIVGTVIALTAIAWILSPLLARVLPGISDAGIAIGSALLLFLLPVGGGRRGLDWDAAERVPWGVLVLFGGGLSLARAAEETRLTEWVGEAMGAIGALPLVLVVGGVAAVVIFVTELTSNTATAAAFLPIASALAVGIGVSPVLLAVPAAMAASCGFMMPVGTPPNAMVYATGRVTIQQMMRAGIWLNLMFAVLITLLVMALVPIVIG